MRARFFKIKGQYFAARTIVSVRKTKASIGIDKVSRNIVITVTPEAIGGSKDPKHCSIWASEEEAAELLEILEAETAHNGKKELG